MHMPSDTRPVLRDITNKPVQPTRIKNAPIVILEPVVAAVSSQSEKQVHWPESCEITGESTLLKSQFPLQTHNTDLDYFANEIAQSLAHFSQNQAHEHMTFIYHKLITKLDLQARDIFPSPKKYRAERHKSTTLTQRRELIIKSLKDILALMEKHLPSSVKHDGTKPIKVLKKALRTVLHENKITHGLKKLPMAPTARLRHPHLTEQQSTPQRGQRREGVTVGCGGAAANCVVM
jgi:hypothetical protein